MAVVGNNLIVYRDGVAIAGTRSNEVSASGGLTETASSTSGTWRSYLPDRKEWSVSVGYLVGSESGVADLLSVGNTYTLLFKGDNAQGVTGQAIMTECRITATIGTLVVGSFSFKGNGPLSAETI